MIDNNLKDSLNKILSKYSASSYAIIKLDDSYTEQQKRQIFTFLIKKSYSITKVALVADAKDNPHSQTYCCNYPFIYFVVNKDNDSAFEENILALHQLLELKYFYVHNGKDIINFDDLDLYKITDRCDYCISDIKSIATIRSLKMKDDYMLNFY